MDCMVDGIMPGQIHAYSIIPEVLIAAVFGGYVGFPPQRLSPNGGGARGEIGGGSCSIGLN